MSNASNLPVFGYNPYKDQGQIYIKDSDVGTTETSVTSDPDKYTVSVGTTQSALEFVWETKPGADKTSFTISPDSLSGYQCVADDNNLVVVNNPSADVLWKRKVTDTDYWKFYTGTGSQTRYWQSNGADDKVTLTSSESSATSWYVVSKE